MNWHILKCIGGHEREAADDIDKLMGKAFYPVETRHVRGRGKMGKPVIRAIRSPMMPTYVFARWNSYDPPWHALALSRYLSGYLATDLGNGPPAFVTDVQIDDMRNWSAASAGTSSGRGLRVGDMMRITSGPYAGWESEIEDIKGMMLTLRVMQFNRMFPMQVRADQAERAA